VAQNDLVVMSKAAVARSNKATRVSPQKTAMTLSTSPQTSVPDVRERPLAIETKPALGEKLLALVAIITSVISARANAA
jgi:hypothetical protein